MFRGCFFLVLEQSSGRIALRPPQSAGRGDMVFSPIFFTSVGGCRGFYRRTDSAKT
jgi:hypothetical protein